jgi:hypothetical protein
MFQSQDDIQPCHIVIKMRPSPRPNNLYNRHIYRKSSKMASSAGPQKCNIVMAPNPIPPAGSGSGPAIFLSGSIDAPPATWQSTLSTALSHLPVTILNPHRADWDASWKEVISDQRFREQVNWELDGIERADIVAVYFGPKAQAPITVRIFISFSFVSSLERCEHVLSPEA